MSDEILDDLDFGEDDFSKRELENHLRIFIGKRADYYIEDWKNPKLFSFDFLKMLLGIPWMMYRKMYVFPFLIIFFSFLRVGTPGLLFIVPLYGVSYWMGHWGDESIIRIVVSICCLLLSIITCGFFSKRIYLRHAIRQVNVLRSTFHGDDLIQKLEDNGGTSGFLPTVTLLGLLFFLLSELSTGMNTILTF